MFISDRVSVCIVGDSIVYWAGLQARRDGQPSLGLQASLRWEGRRGLQLSQLPEVVGSLLQEDDNFRPAILVIHAGTNDIGRCEKRLLRRVVTGAIQQIQEYLPHTRLVWSEIIPRQKYKGFGEEDQPRVETVRLAMNKWAHAECRRLGGVSVAHPCFRYNEEQLYWTDGVHLSETGGGVLLEDLQAIRQLL